MTNVNVNYVKSTGFSVKQLVNTLKASTGDIQRKLSLVDEYHIGGHEATKSLAELISPPKGSTVLDIGSGLGGSARYLAGRFGCNVLGVEYLPEFCQAASELSRLSKLCQLNDWTENTSSNSNVWFKRGDMAKLKECIPADLSFDSVWMQHVSMHCPADLKSKMFTDINKQLKPGGTLAIHEIVLGNNCQSQDDLHLPVPFGLSPNDMHLLSTQDFLKIIESAGFTDVNVKDVTKECLKWYDQPRTKTSIDMRLVMGSNAGLKSRNMRRNLQEDKCRVIQALFTKKIQSKI